MWLCLAKDLLEISVIRWDVVKGWCERAHNKRRLHRNLKTDRAAISNLGRANIEVIKQNSMTDCFLNSHK